MIILKYFVSCHTKTGKQGLGPKIIENSVRLWKEPNFLIISSFFLLVQVPSVYSCEKTELLKAVHWLISL